MEEKVKESLRKLTNKGNIFLVDRGNTALKLILGSLNGQVYIQNQGGWLNYKKIPDVKEIKTDYGIIDLEELNKIDENSVLIVNSLSGYFAEQPMKEIIKICEEKNCTVINDVSGSIGNNGLCKEGNFIFGSFGKWKPINLEYGGFIATDKKIKMGENFDEDKLSELYKKLTYLKERLILFNILQRRVKENLNNFEVIHKESNGINVIVKFNNEEEKEELIKYCKDNNYEYTLCPRYIRVNCKAVSIELKRK